MTKQEISGIYNRPLLDLIYDPATIHRNNNDYYARGGVLAVSLVGLTV